MRKRYLGMLVMVMTFTLVLFGCGNPAEEGKKAFAGLWSVDSVSSSGAEATGMEGELIQYMGTYLTLNSDGSASFELMGLTIDGTWTASDATTATVNLSDDSGLGLSGAQEMKLEDNKLIMVSENESATFVKIDPSEKKESDIAAALGDALSESLSGSDVTSTTGSAEMLSNAEKLDVSLADTDSYAVRLTALGDYLGDPAYVVEVTNKSKLTLEVDDDNEFKVAGVVVSPVFSLEVAPGTTADELLWFSNEDIGGAGLEALKKDVSGKLIVRNADTGEELGRLDFAMSNQGAK